MADTALERVLKRDRAITALGLAATAALAWVYTIHTSMGDMAGAASGMSMPSGMAMPQDRPWTGTDFLLMFAMWMVMMVAMMLPSAAPMILMFASSNRKRQQAQNPYLTTSLFAGAYVVVWAGFALIATLANWAFHSNGLMTSAMGRALPLWGGVLLIAAGVYQFMPLKLACLNKCRSPLAFLMSEWREGRLGTFVMGLRHGGYCLLCCWALMALLFVLGVMNLAWIAILTAFVLIEKLASTGPWLSRASGLLLLGWGVWLAGSAFPI
jgi:predicted metal-binding membrane protein